GGSQRADLAPDGLAPERLAPQGLSALRLGSIRDAARRASPIRIRVRPIAVAARGCLAGDDDDPRWTVRRERLAPRDLDGPPEGLVAGELQGDEARDPCRRDPLELRRRLLTQQRERPAARPGIARNRQGDPRRGRAPATVIGGHGRSGPWHVRRDMDRERRSAATLDRDRAAEKRRDR